MVERGEGTVDERTDGKRLSELDEPSQLGAAEPVAVGRVPRARRNGRRVKMPRSWLLVLVPVVLIGLALVPTVSSGLEKTPRDRVGISYGGGPFEGVHYQRIVEPGSNLFFNGLFDSLYLYPADQVNYIVSQGRRDDGQPAADALVAPTGDRVEVIYQIAVYFKLNVDELRAFHEQLGLRYRAYTGDGWNNLIDDTLRQQIDNALQEETRQVAVAGLIGDADLLVDLQTRLQEKLSQQLEHALGHRFFCAPTYEPGGECGDPTFVINQVDIPTSVTEAFRNARTSEIEIETRENEVQQRQAEAEAMDALGMTPEEYNILKAIESDRIEFWVLPNDSGVTIQGPDAGAAGRGAGG